MKGISRFKQTFQVTFTDVNGLKYNGIIKAMGTDDAITEIRRKYVVRGNIDIQMLSSQQVFVPIE